MEISKQTIATTEQLSKNNVIAEILCMRMEELLERLEINLTRSGKMYIGPCPIHGGKRASGLNLYIEGDRIPGFWTCHTKKCHQIFKSTIIGFIRGVLSRQRANWCKEDRHNKVVPFKDVLAWICDFIGQKYNEIKVDPEEVEKRRFASLVGNLSIPEKKKGGLDRSAVRSSLQIPAEYYIKRGFAEQILDRYDVGLCLNSAKPFYGKIVVPVYDENSGLMVGALARSVHERCDNCRAYHGRDSDCPKTDKEKHFAAKWINSIQSSEFLYNLWSAKQHISHSGEAIIVEGPPDVWRLEEAGIKNAVALFGTSISDTQQILLEMSGAISLTVLLDNDEAGTYGSQKIREELINFKLTFPKYSAPDIGDMSVEQIRKELLL